MAYGKILQPVDVDRSNLIPLQMIPNQVHEIELQLGTLWR